MRLDADLVREIMLELEKTPPNRSAAEIVLEPWDHDMVLEHIEVMDEGGLLEARLEYAVRGSHRIRAAHIARLTWQGHEFLDNARNEQAWNSARSQVARHGGSVSLGVLKQLLAAATVRHFSKVT